MLDLPKPPAPSIAPRTSLILRPGMPSLPPGLERYRIRGQGSIVVPVEAGDEITLIDVEGGQACEIGHVDASGRFDAAALGARATGAAEGLKSVLAQDGESGRRTRLALERRAIDIGKAIGGADVRRLLAGGREGHLSGRCATASSSPPHPGATWIPANRTPRRRSSSWCSDAGCAPARQAIDRCPSPWPIPCRTSGSRRRPPQAYVVKAGEYIQVIDVAGRQCSDFQCFSLRKIDKGVENALDATVTRTLTGRSYPTPGLPSKAFGRDFEPLVEIVHDTVGRHDAFATACNSRYYDDMGYPGHVNCTENFNNALAPYGVARRKGWEALNYFYNTNIDANNQLYLDEPWSRPGDYVLMRALTDLVCVSSSCPDDIDAANGWEPTDIHLRTYSAQEKFSRAVAYRMTPDAEAVLTRETAFHPRFSALTRNYTEYRGYWLPQRFNNANAIEEYWACRERVAVMDLSPLRKFEVTGPDAEALLQHCLTRDMRRMSPGQVVYTAMCYEHGGMIDDGTVFRLAQNNFRWIGGDEFGGLWLRQQAREDGLHGLGALVHRSVAQHRRAGSEEPRSPQGDRLDAAGAAGPRRAGVVPLLRRPHRRFRRRADRRVAHRLHGRARLRNILPSERCPRACSTRCGRKAGNTACRRSASKRSTWCASRRGSSSPTTSSPTRPIPSRPASASPCRSRRRPTTSSAGRRSSERKAHPRHRLVGLEIDVNEAVGHGDCVHIGRAQIGTVTSGVRSPILKKNIALARVDVVHAAIGTEVEIGKLDGHQKRLPARIVPFPHYDPQKMRVKS